jgi:hypothetical protein
MSENKTILLHYKSATANEIVWPCIIKVPLSGGVFQDQELKARFRVLPEERLEFLYPNPNSILALVEAAVQAQAAPVAETPLRRGDEGLLDLALVGLVDVPGADGKSEADVAQQLRGVPYIRDGLVRGYSEMIGRRVAKN